MKTILRSNSSKPSRQTAKNYSVNFRTITKAEKDFN